MPEIILPDGTRQVLKEETTLTPFETTVIELLNVIARTVDVMVRLECGAVLRKDLKRDILETEQAIRAYRKEQLAEAEASAALDGETQAVEPDSHDQYHGKDPEQDNLPEALTAE